MAERKATGLTGRIALEGAGERSEQPALAVHAMTAEGKVAGSAKVGADGSFTLAAAALDKASRVVIGDAAADPTAEGDRFIGYRVEEARELFAGDLVALPESHWGQYFGYTQCVSGHVQRCYPYWPLVEYIKASTSISALASLSASTRSSKFVDISVIDPSIIYHPYRCATICQGLVEVYRRTCCCEPPIIIDPGDIVDGPVIDWPPPWPPPGDPWFPEPHDPPGPVPVPPGPGPDPAPLELLDQVASGGALDVRKMNAERDTFALQNLKGAQLSEYIKLRPYLWCTCGAGTKVAEGLIADDGSFSVCWRDFPRFLLPNCSEEYSYKVKQVIEGVTVTIYDGPAAGQWFSAGANPTLTSYSRSAVSCIGDPVIPGAGDAIVLLHQIGSTFSHHLGTPTQNSPDSVNALGFSSGLLDPSAMDGPTTNLPLGGTLGLRYFFSKGMQTLGARFFRVDVASTDGTGMATSGWAPVPVPAWNSWKWVSGTGFIRAQHSLGPNGAGQYIIPFGTGGPLTALEEWDPDQFHALLDTTAHADGKYLIRIQVFDGAGNQIKPTGAAGPGTARPALTHALWWDNRPAVAHIEGVRGSGGSTTCQFLEGPAGASVSIDYRAYHPHPVAAPAPPAPSFFHSFSLTVVKGIGGGTPVSASGYTEQGKPPDPAAVLGTTIGGLLGPTDTRCSFAVTLSAAVKTTNGGGRLSYLDRSDVAAFAALKT
jgi:hypothetical protein